MHRRLPWVLAWLLAGCARSPEGPERPNVLLITIDTLRADRISAAGSPRVTTPNLDRLAEEGLRFTHAETPRAKTTPAIASLLTGLYPHDHGVRDLLAPLDARWPVLAESLKGAGYSTGAIVGNYVLLDRHSGLRRGFDSWCEDLPEQQGVPPDDVPQRTARSLTDGALERLGTGPASIARTGAPWFLWLHYMDPHGLYDPPEEHRIFHSETPDPIPRDALAATGELHRPHVAEYNVPPGCRTDHGAIDAARVRDLYDGEVHYADAEIGRLLETLRAEGILDRTLVVVTSDHGESLGEHRYWFEHGRDAYEASCRVPLIVRFPRSPADRRPPAPGVRHGDLSLADLAPTILDWLGLPPLQPKPTDHARSVRGVSRRALFEREDAGPSAVFTEKVDRIERSGAVQSKAVRRGDWKLVRNYALRFGEGATAEKQLVVLSEELYDLAQDPGETANLFADPPPAAPLARLQAELLFFASADVQFPDLARLLQGQRERLEREDREALRILEALGY